MAIAAGSIVMILGLSGNELVGTEPVQGVVYVFADPSCDVLWSGGTISSENIPKTMLSEITAAASGTRDLIGQRVRVAGQNAALDINVIKAFKRDGTDKVAGTTLSGTWRELTASAVTVIS